MKIINLQDINEQIFNRTSTNKDLAIDLLDEIIHLLPPTLKTLINQAFKHKRIPKEYLLSSILFTISTAMGRTFYTNSLGYKNYGNLYFTIIGSRGDTKSAAMDIAIDPLKRKDDQFFEEYWQEIEHYDRNKGFDLPKPKRKQLLLSNATIEAAHEAHYNNPISIGIFMDEIYTLIDNMGNKLSRDGIAWRGFFLEGFTNKHIDIARKTTKSFRIKNSYPTLLGALQKQFLVNLFAKGNPESGFIDRLLFTLKLTSNTKLSFDDIPIETTNNYNHLIAKILSYKETYENQLNNENEINIAFECDAENLMHSYTQELIIEQTKPKPFIQEYIAKMQIVIHKLCLVVHIMKMQQDEFIYGSKISLQTVELAIKLITFYFLNFKIIIEENFTNLSSKNKNNLDEIIKMAIENKAQQKDVVAITGFDKGYISKKWNIILNNMQQATSNQKNNAVNY